MSMFYSLYSYFWCLEKLFIVYFATLLHLSFLDVFFHIFEFVMYNMLFVNSDSFTICIPLIFFSCLIDAGSSWAQLWEEVGIVTITVHSCLHLDGFKFFSI